MDAAYLKKNVGVALAEGLASMTITMPEDKVLFLGKYLLEYVERQSKKSLENERMKEIYRKESESINEDTFLSMKEEAKRKAVEDKELELKTFLKGLDSIPKTKAQVLDSCMLFLTEYLSIPAAYTAIKKPTADSEALFYISSNPSQESVIKGKKIS